MIQRLIVAIVAIAVLAIAVVLLLGYTVGSYPEIAAVQTPQRSAFGEATIARGRELASIGNCAACHSADNREPLAGGRPLETPYGVIYADNITPDTGTGIGAWSLAAFTRALRDGIDRQGHHLYPAFPYNHFAKLTDADIGALYAYLMTRTAVDATTPANGLYFPFNIRSLMTEWNLLFLDKNPVEPDAAHTAEWNRGAYLAEALAHCGACHTPRNFLQGEETSAALSGGEAEGWNAPAIDASSKAPVAWTVDELVTYLGTGIELHHGAAAGPMQLVARQLGQASPADIHAIAVYVASMMPKTPMSHPTASPPPADATAEAIVEGVCANCHAPNAPIAEGRWPAFSASTTLQEDLPRNAVQILRNGIPIPPGTGGPFMPGFAHILNDAQIAQVANYLRGHFAGRPAWGNAGDVAQDIAEEQGAQP